MISIITPCLNSVRFVNEAIDSVRNQGIEALEHIVVDGGSTDGTRAVLATHAHLRRIEGSDTGIYDALNKGLNLAGGSLIGFLNADDCYAPGALAGMLRAFDDAGVMAVAGRAVAFADSGELGESGEADRAVRTFPPAGENLLYHCTLGNPTMNAWLFRKEVFARLGGFDATYRIAGDREFMLRLACADMRHATIADLIYRYRVHSESTTFAGNDAVWHTVMREHMAISGRYLRKPALSAAARGMIRSARTRDTLQAAAYTWRRHEWRSFARYAGAGMRHDLLWPLKLMRRTAQAGLKSVK